MTCRPILSPAYQMLFILLILLVYPNLKILYTTILPPHFLFTTPRNTLFFYGSSIDISKTYCYHHIVENSTSKVGMLYNKQNREMERGEEN